MTTPKPFKAHSTYSYSYDGGTDSMFLVNNDYGKQYLMDADDRHKLKVRLAVTWVILSIVILFAMITFTVYAVTKIKNIDLDKPIGEKKNTSDSNQPKINPKAQNIENLMSDKKFADDENTALLGSNGERKD